MKLVIEILEKRLNDEIFNLKINESVKLSPVDDIGMQDYINSCIEKNKAKIKSIEKAIFYLKQFSK